MAIKKSFGTSKFSFNAYFPGFSKPTLNHYSAAGAKKLYHTSFTEQKPLEYTISRYYRPTYFKHNKTSYFNFFSIPKYPTEKKEFIDYVNELIDNGKTKKAFIALKDKVQESPYNFQSMLLISNLEEQFGNHFKALEYYRRANAIKKFLSKKYNKRNEFQNPVYNDYSLKYNFIPVNACEYFKNDNGNENGAKTNCFQVNLMQVLLSVFLFFTACSSGDEPDPKPDQEYTITINAESELENKYIKDGTTTYFTETGNDTIFANTKDEKANIKIFASEGREINGTVGIKENKGHYGTKQNVNLTGNEELLLEMNGKNNISTLNISTTYQTKGTATNIKITINPGNVTATTNENGEANIEYENETNEYNEINTNASITAESTPTSNVQIDTKNYTKTIDEAIEEWNFELTKSEYEHNFNNTVKSSLTNKQIKDGTKVGIIINSNNTDTTWTNIINEAYTTTIKSNLATENYQLIFKNIPGHQEKTVNGTSTGTTNKETTLTAKNYNANIPIHLTKNGEDLAGILITGIGADKTTNNTGRETLIDENLETNEFNEALANYTKTATLTGSSIGTVTQEINYKEGNNEEQTFAITPETLTNIINYITNVNSGTAWLVEKGTTDTTFVNIKSDGTATINYEHPYAEENILIIGARSTGKIPQTKEITAISNKEYNEEFNLEDEVTNNTYNLDLIITDVLGDNILNGKTINVKEPDGDIQSKTVSSKNTSFMIEGTYDNGQKIKIWLTPDSEYDGLTGTINQSLKLPLNSIYDPNETKTDTLAVVIGDVDNKTAYVSFMDKTTRDDPDIQSLGEEGGNSQWNYLNGNGEREQNIILAKTTKQGIPTPNDIKQFYNEAVEMLTSKYVTNQGLNLMNVTYDSIPGYPTTFEEGKIYLLVDDAQSTPANAKIGNMPETYNRGYTKLRTFDNEDHDLAILELGECIIPLKDAQATSSNAHQFIWNGTIEDVKIKPLRIALMYKGLTIPDPTP